MDRAVGSKKKVELDTENADPYLLYSVPQTPSGAHKAGLRGEWNGFRPEHRPDSIYWVYWLLLLLALGVTGSLMLRFAGII